ncbi:hypothetical protein [Antarctobacter sp.]|uniref:hypothetical protein n=1 Tax=Antarctobacter sp. TaxID=1872577 RepID=UPI002B2668A5|nr:hypothetical protein [Antarctobacter sp.]
MSPRPFRRKRSDEPDDSYQLDAVVSLFAMILVILVTTAAATVSGTTRFQYRTQDAETAPIQLASLAAPFPRLENWILRRGELLRIDYDAAARQLAAAPPRLPLGATDPQSGIIMAFNPDPTATGAFELFEMVLPADPIVGTGGVIAERIDPEDPEALQDWAVRDAPARVLAFASGVVHLPGLTVAAEAAGRPLTVRFLDGNAKFSERKTRDSFAFRGVLRSY